MKYKIDSLCVLFKMLRPSRSVGIHSPRFVVLGLCLAASTLAVADTAHRSNRFYTPEQAGRGAQVFQQACAHCHSVDREAQRPEGLSGQEFMKRWYSVADLYNKSRWTMPADRVLGLPVEDYLAVTAFLLKVNGLPAGDTPLREDNPGMKEMILSMKAPAEDMAPADAAPGFYSAAQALRGEGYFAGSCAFCHAADQVPLSGKPHPGPAPGPGVRMGSGLVLMPLSGHEPLVPRRSVADLYLKSRTAMPMEYPDALSTQTYLDIVAYLLQQNGYPAGGRELTGDIEAMRAMTLPEAGFRTLFNGRNFTGFGFLLGNNCTPAPHGCGATDPGTTFQVDKGAVHISGRPSGYMYTTDKYLNFTLRLDMRYVPYAGLQTDEDYYSNTGILLFVTDHQIWPKCLEVQGLYRLALSILPIDTKAAFTTDTEARRAAMRPVGQWNAIQIVSEAGKVQVSVNGRLVTTVTEHEFTAPGHIGFQSEGSEVYLRNIRIRESP